MSQDAQLKPTTTLAFLKFYGSDFLNSTASWSMEERGLYITLLWYSWVNDGLPADVGRIERMAPGAAQAWEVLGGKFPVAEDGKRRNPRQERDRAALLDQYRKWSDRGKAGASARWSSNATSIPEASPKHCLPDGNQISDIRYQIERERDNLLIPSDERAIVKAQGAIQAAPKAQVVYASFSEARRAPIRAEDIERVWGRFPRKVGKLKAMTLIPVAIRRIMDEWDHDKPDDAIIYLMERIDALAKKHKNGDPKFIPHPSTWLNQGRYLDPIEAQ